ncbi:MAG: hypothetical protein JWM10_1972 [Myxococcaceae bacterium]|nr:hypothetical protein [Myxococcaceae bacterium]
MRPNPRGNLLDRTPSEIEASAFAKTYALARVTGGDDAADPRLRGMKRAAWKAQLLGDAAELEALFGDDDHAEVVSLWIDRRALQDRTLATGAMQAYARFLADAAGDAGPDDQRSLGNALAVSYDQTRTFAAVLEALPWVPRDGAGAATEVFLGKRMEASATFAKKNATLVVRNEEGGRRLHVGVATQRAVFDLGQLLFSAPIGFAKGDRTGVAGWKTQEIDATPFGRRFSLELDRSGKPVGRIARRHFGFARIARTAKLELLIEPTRGMVGVVLKVDPDWIESSETNYFAALELLTAFVAEGLGDAPDARSRVEIGDLFSCAPGDDELFNAIKKELPFVLKGKNGAATAVFLGEEDRAEASLDEGMVLVRMMEGADGWLECAFLLTEFLEDIDAVE